MVLLLVACVEPAMPDGSLPSSPSISTGDTGESSTSTITTTTTTTTHPNSLCTWDVDHRSCPHDTVSLPTGWGPRDVHVGRPAGTPPADGWPVAILFQGSFFNAAWMWDATPTTAFGGWYQTELIGRLLDAGYVVLTPEALFDGATYWTTNVPPYSLAWSTSPDDALMQALFAAIDDGTLRDVDPERLYAGGISSGGYMSSRMAEAYPGRFRALAVHSASWCTCSGGLCVVPALPGDHPPTLFLHGEQDPLAPLWAMERYAEQMDAQGLEHRVVTDPALGHTWLPVSPHEVVAWFDGHPF
ncbi:MAG: dienelactone hydrolase family protein [Alphaproteobacteria bacterium]|nr:dienelactone hydrolase family protein [Alphaproteobacteria bacterium]MCB9697454.1 dienelactone hydrolase family protein [Alphaproteobacteria bacterium]